jgi:Lysozyme like domain
MIKRVLVLLLATATLCGGLYVLRAGKPRKLSPTADIGLGLESDVAPSAPHEPPPPILTPHIVGLIVAAVLLGTAAYLGLGDSTGVAAVTPLSPSPAAAFVTAAPEPDVNTSLRDEIESIGSNSRNAAAKAAGAPAPSPAPPAAELQPPGRTARSAVYASIQTPTDGFEAIVCSKPWPCAEAIAVASCESGLDRHGRLDGNWATNGTNYGLFQINGVHANSWPDFYQDWMDPVKNTEWAFEIWLKSGWAPWECKPVLLSGQTDWVYLGATVAPEPPTDTPPPVASPTPTPTPTPSETPPALVTAAPTPSPPVFSSPTPAATP